MPRKPTKAQKEKASASEVIDRIFAEVDPEVLLAGLLGGIAAKGGLTPPFTSLLMSLSGDEGIANNLVDKFKLVYAAGSPALAWYTATDYLVNLLKDKREGNAQENEATVAASAIVASGAFEGMLMMTFAKNPEFQKTVYNMLSSGTSGLGALAKAL